jgi:peptide/nickel transport system substrate-binding protein
VKLAVTLISALLLATAGTASSVAQTPKRGGILNHVVESETATLDCHATATSFSLQLLAPHYSTLLRYEPGKYPNIVGDLADSWTISPDGQTYTFKLHPDVTFHDGSKLTSTDIKATYQKIMAPPEGVISARKEQLADIETIDTPDPQMVVFRLRKPSAVMLSVFASPWNCVYSAAKLAQDPKYYATNVMGTGPFVFADYAKGSSWSGKRNENYFRKGLPYLDGIKASFISGAGVINALAGGQVDATFFLISPPDKTRLESSADGKIVFQEGALNVMNLLTFNVKAPPFNDARVRRAINLAIDRKEGDAILSKIAPLKGYGLLMPGGTPYELKPDELAKLPGFSADIEARRKEARQLLADAGVPNLKFTLLNRNLRQPWEPVGIFVIDQLRKIGLTIDQTQAETPQYFSALQSGNYTLALDFLNVLSADPTETLVKYVPGGALNYSGVQDDTLTKLFDQQSRASDQSERIKLVRQFEERIVTEAYSVPLFRSIRINALRSDVKGWKTAPSTVLNLDLAEVWLDR